MDNCFDEQYDLGLEEDEQRMEMENEEELNQDNELKYKAMKKRKD